MSRNLPAKARNEGAIVLPKNFDIRVRPVRQNDVKNLFDNLALEKFSTENIDEPSPDHLEYESKGLTNIEAAVTHVARNAARGDKTDIRYLLDRTVGPVPTEQRSVNLTMSLSDFLRKDELNDASEMELAEAGIVIAEVTNAEAEENYAADL